MKIKHFLMKMRENFRNFKEDKLIVNELIEWSLKDLITDEDEKLSPWEKLSILFFFFTFFELIVLGK